jgi:prevent-host-death family protein
MYKIFEFVQNALFPMRSIPLSEFRANAAAMLDLVEQGESLCILRHGKPVAEIVPPRPVELKLPSWKRPVEPLKYLRKPEKTGAQLIIEERESGW